MPHRRPFLVAVSFLRAALLAGTVVTLAACGDSSSGGGTTSPDAAGPYPPASTTVVLTDPSRSRSLTVEVWYPAVASAENAAKAGAPVEDFFSSPDDRARYAALLADSPEPEGPSRRTHAARDAAPASSSSGYPLLVFSHCFQCFRFSAFSIAERLASHGFVVAAPDHAGDTLFDATLGLNADTLQTRGADIRFVATALLAGSDGAEALPASLRGGLDASRVGVFGHSFGSVTTGLVLQDDARFRAGVGIAAPFENPLLPGISMSRIAEPVLFLVAREDNSIAEIGNNFIRQNFEQAGSPIRKVEVTDAGHWSFSDICRLGDRYFLPGCGAGVRQTTPGAPFTYLPIEEGVAIGQAYVTAFFLAELQGDAAARAYLESANPAGIVDVAARN